ncbi:nucleotidyltransferase family protein [Bdellovibrio sp. HCB-110]|uniref:nucleotidyltransferase family protein n=1 Tax=Bdellovibrio sp. HCB-110 TaxID=3391182 RepID=UPI0039B51FC3
MIKPLGLSESQNEFIENVLRDFLKQKTQFTVSIFGSRVRGGYRQYSDLDLWIESVPPLDRTEEADLRSLFEESELPIKVDIVTPETCLPSYLENISAEKKIWLNKY